MRELKKTGCVRNFEWCLRWVFLWIAALPSVGCRTQSSPDIVQGYVEGEYVYVAAPYGGRLERLSVTRGQKVDEKAELFSLDAAPQKAARDEAQSRWEQARATLADLRKGLRPTEIESLEAQLKQAKAALVQSILEFDRLEKLKPRAVSVEEFEEARAVRDQDQAKVLQLEAELKTSRLGSREDQVLAAEEVVKAQEAALARARWDLSQMTQTSDRVSLVFDTLFREGEWVAAGRPVVMLLPPANVKVRAFVPQPRIGMVKLGDEVEVGIDGMDQAIRGKISFIAANAEYTPPVIYSRQARSKLVFRIEVVFDSDAAAELHPGQPVDVRLK